MEILSGESSALRPEAKMKKSQPLMQLKDMSECMVMPQQGFVLMSVAHMTTKDHEDISCLSSCLGKHRCPGVVLSCPCPH